MIQTQPLQRQEPSVVTAVSPGRWSFQIPMTPEPKGRPRAARVGGSVRMITPTKTRSWEATIAAFAASVLPRSPLEGQLRVDILAVMPRPGRLMRRKDPDGLLWAPTRPDADNIRKAVLDGMSACWRDDAQVVAGDTLKVYAEKDGKPRLLVVVCVLDEETPDAAIERMLSLYRGVA